MPKYHKYTGHTTRTFRKLYGYKNLLAWQAADELANLIHRLVVQFEYRYSKLTSQMLGSASSVKANIAEGYCRNALGDYIRFCEIARGSLGELGSQIQDCERWGLIQGAELAQLVELFGDATYMLEQLIKGLRIQRKEGTWDRNLGMKEESAEYAIGETDIHFVWPDEEEDS